MDKQGGGNAEESQQKEVKVPWRSRRCEERKAAGESTTDCSWNPQSSSPDSPISHRRRTDFFSPSRWTRGDADDRQREISAAAAAAAAAGGGGGGGGGFRRCQPPPTSTLFAGDKRWSSSHASASASSSSFASTTATFRSGPQSYGTPNLRRCLTPRAFVPGRRPVLFYSKDHKFVIIPTVTLIEGETEFLMTSTAPTRRPSMYSSTTSGGSGESELPGRLRPLTSTGVRVLMDHNDAPKPITSSVNMLSGQDNVPVSGVDNAQVLLRWIPYTGSLNRVGIADPFHDEIGNERRRSSHLQSVDEAGKCTTGPCTSASASAITPPSPRAGGSLSAMTFSAAMENIFDRVRGALLAAFRFLHPVLQEVRAVCEADSEIPSMRLAVRIGRSVYHARPQSRTGAVDLDTVGSFTLRDLEGDISSRRLIKTFEVCLSEEGMDNIISRFLLLGDGPDTVQRKQKYSLALDVRTAGKQETDLLKCTYQPVEVSPGHFQLKVKKVEGVRPAVNVAGGRIAAVFGWMVRIATITRSSKLRQVFLTVQPPVPPARVGMPPQYQPQSLWNSQAWGPPQQQPTVSWPASIPWGGNALPSHVPVSGVTPTHMPAQMPTHQLPPTVPVNPHGFHKQGGSSASSGGGKGPTANNFLGPANRAYFTKEYMEILEGIKSSKAIDEAKKKLGAPRNSVVARSGPQSRELFDDGSRFDSRSTDKSEDMKAWVTTTLGESLKLINSKLDSVDRKSKLDADEREELERLRKEAQGGKDKELSSNEKRKRCGVHTPVENSPSAARARPRSKGSSKTNPKRIQLSDNEGPSRTKQNLQSKLESTSCELSDIKRMLAALMSGLADPKGKSKVIERSNARQGPGEGDGEGTDMAQNAQVECDEDDPDEDGFASYMKVRADYYGSLHYTRVQEMCKEREIEYFKKDVAVWELARQDLQEYADSLREERSTREGDKARRKELSAEPGHDDTREDRDTVKGN
ncbi:hypothetical protein CBR_g39802 [Chara braunii]|uniref:Uncharacterized protein n=1 Tax=Chara braunii TaxID=69332 RepID=A0A388LSC2_CHABU|nr:hypothetical protein CBR_g39802 [Chara braunii]|eukprot:GBG85236.1 hypothetical protein CBR_g39802 [Chara braunii]